MKKTYLYLFLAAFLFTACSDDDETTTPQIDNPTSYTFERNGASSVSFSGQTTRILMAEELISAMKDFDGATEASLLEMFRNETADGGDANPFSSSDLNAATKNIKGKTAASTDFFAANATESSTIKADFEAWVKAQVEEVFPNEQIAAAPGVAGQIADGTSTRYVSAKGLEYNQVVAKSLIGALMTDQSLNNYLGTAVLDEADNRATNNDKVLEDSKNYTSMEHKWDEAYGYLYGNSMDKANPNLTIGDDDSFLNNYIATVDGDSDFTGIADDIFNAFKLGRAAIVANDYTVRDEQANLIRGKISQVIAVRSVHYLEAGKEAVASESYGAAFHDLSEAYGFVYSLRFTRQPNSDSPYFTKAEVDGFLEAMLGDGPNGLWDVETSTLEEISATIAAKFSFTVAETAS